MKLKMKEYEELKAELKKNNIAIILQEQDPRGLKRASLKRGALSNHENNTAYFIYINNLSF